MIVFQTLTLFTVGAVVTWKGWLTFILEIITFYIFQYYVVPKVFEKKNISTFSIRFAVLLAMFLVIRGLIIDPKKGLVDFLRFILSFEQLIYASVLLFLVLGLGFIMGLFKRNEQLGSNYIKAIREKLEAEAEKLRVESALSQVRLNSHLQFNTLNYIKVKAQYKVPEIGRPVDLLAGLLRHSMIDVQDAKKIPLSEEITEIKHLIELYRELADEHFYIEVKEHFEDQKIQFTIPPSILLTLVENIARYGVVNDPDYTAGINVNLTQTLFSFETWNYKKLHPQQGTGLGISSIAITLQYYFPDKHTLEIENLEETFHLKLTILL